MTVEKVMMRWKYEKVLYYKVLVCKAYLQMTIKNKENFYFLHELSTIYTIQQNPSLRCGKILVPSCLCLRGCSAGEVVHSTK